MEHACSPFMRSRDAKAVSLSLANPPVPDADPCQALADQWERQAQQLDAIHATTPGGCPSAMHTAALLRGNAAELVAALYQRGGRRS